MKVIKLRNVTLETVKPKKKRAAPQTKYNVEPLRTKQEIEDMKWSLSRHCTERDRFMFVFGINTGLRVSDILPLKVKDVRGKNHVRLIEKKTKKDRNVNVMGIVEEIESYTKGMDDEDYLFQSRKGSKPITDTQAYRALVQAGKMIDRVDIGTHTMRKTFGYHYYKKTKDVATLQEIFNHSYPSITKKYIGIRQEEIDETLVGFKL